MIPYARHSIDRSDHDAVDEALSSGTIAQGPLVREFEDKIREFVGAKFAVCFSSGTAALHAAYFAIKQREPLLHSFSVPALTFVATANAAEMVTGTPPDLLDVNQFTLCASWRDSERINVAVDYAGHPAFAHINLHQPYWDVVDAAHSFGARYRERIVGSDGRAQVTCFSFHPAKLITTGEGGALVTDDTTISETARCFRDHGRNCRGDTILVGSNYRMPEMSAALGISQLRRAHPFLERRAEIAAAYSRAFEGLMGIELPTVQPWAQSAWHLYVLRVDAGKRDQFRAALAAREVGTQVHYRPVYRHPKWEDIADECAATCPITELEWPRLVSIPMWCFSDDVLRHVIKSVRDAAQEVL